MTLAVQVASAASVDGQLLVCAKSPSVDTAEIGAAAVPVLRTVTVCAARWSCRRSACRTRRWSGRRSAGPTAAGGEEVGGLVGPLFHCGAGQGPQNGVAVYQPELPAPWVIWKPGADAVVDRVGLRDPGRGHVRERDLAGRLHLEGVRARRPGCGRC